MSHYIFITNVSSNRRITGEQQNLYREPVSYIFTTKSQVFGTYIVNVHTMVSGMGFKQTISNVRKINKTLPNVPTCLSRNSQTYIMSEMNNKLLIIIIFKIINIKYICLYIIQVMVK